MSRLPLHALQGFAAAARSGNLTRAADTMHLTVSALSHQVRTLEERLGCRLFVRNARGVALTEAGERLMVQVGPHLDALEHALRPRRARREDVLTISVMPSMASAWLVPRLGDFLGAHPQIELNLQSSERLVDFERDQDVDAALRMGRGKWPGVEVEHLLEERLAPVASPALLQRLGRPTDDNLHEWPLLGERGGNWARWFAHVGGREPARYVASIDDIESLQRAAVDGMGIALGRMVRSSALVNAGQLVVLSERRLASDFDHYLVYPPRTAGHPGFEVFRAWLHAQAADAPAPGPRPASVRSAS